MGYASPKFTPSDVNRAGRILASDLSTVSEEEWLWAYTVLGNWRSCHGYPMNTFQSTLRQKLKNIDKDALVAQRLKRTPSVIAKLFRFKTMKLIQMQDMGGLRAVLNSMTRVKILDENYRNSKFKHKLVSFKNYIENTKSDGYRSIHLVFRYENPHASQYNGLLIELQIRTRLQHAWATAVETMGTFLGQALKSGEGDRLWREFFEVTSAAFTHIERTNPVPGYEGMTKMDVFRLVAEMEGRLHVLNKLRGFSIAADKITTEAGGGKYHLVVLNSSDRSVIIKPFSFDQLDEAVAEYGRIEERTKNGELIESVLVSAGPVEALRKAYPNYFLDTHDFIRRVEAMIKEAQINS